MIDNEARFQRLTENAQEVIYRFSFLPRRGFDYISRAVIGLLGYTPEDYYGDADLIFKMVSPEDKRYLVENARLAEQLKQPQIIRWRHRDGRLIWTEHRGTPIFDESGKQVAIEGIVRDITAYKEAEQALRESEERYRSVVDVLAEGIVLHDSTGQIVTGNRSASQILGEDLSNGLPDNMISWATLNEDGTPMKNDDRPSVLAMRTGRAQQNKIMGVRRKDGSVRWISINAQAMLQPDHSAPYAVVTSFSDVTEVKRRDRERQISARLSVVLRKAATRTEMMPIILDNILDLLDVQGVAIDMIDNTTKEVWTVLARGSWEHVTGVRSPLTAGVSGKIIASGQPFMTADIRTISDVTYNPENLNGLYSLVCMPLNAEGQTIGVLWAGRTTVFAEEDVHLLKTISEIAAIGLYRVGILEDLEKRFAERTVELESAYERLKELDRLKSKFISDISHELRTPITNLNSYIYLLEHGKPEHFPRYKAVLKNQIERLKSLLETVLDLSRLELGADKTAFKAVDFNDVVERVVIAHIPRANAVNLRVELDLATNLPLIQGESNQLAQVVTNLLSNALNYTTKGEIYVATSWVEPQRQVCLTVEDTGLGIDREDIPHLFERFYRGKHASQSNIPGTGLGLGIVKEIVDLHHGTIEVNSEVGKGSTFRVSFPVTHEPA